MGKLNYGTTGLSYQVEKPAMNLGGAPQCPRCNQRVYFNEEKRALGKVWHTRCFRCGSCNKSLDSTTCSGHENEIFCTPCYKREYGPKGYGFAGGAAGLARESTAQNGHQAAPPQTHSVPSENVNPSDPNCCPRCGKKVYFAEQVTTLGRNWHRLCFKCAECKRMLEKGRCSEHNGDLFCQSCYGKHFGPKGYGFAGGAASMMSHDTSNRAEYKTQITSQPSNSTVYKAQTNAEQPMSPPNMPTNGVQSQEWTEPLYI